MPRKGHTEEQIVYALRQIEGGKKVKNSVYHRREARNHARYEGSQLAVDLSLGRHDAFKWNGLNVSDPVRLHVQLGQKHVADLDRVIECIHPHARAAFDNRSMEKAFCWRHRQEHGHFLPPAGLAENQHA